MTKLHPAVDPEERRKGIGGSDAAAALGLSPWKTPFELWLEKTGHVEPPDLSTIEAVRWGSILEGEILQEYAARAGVQVERPKGVFVSKSHPFLRANPDGLIVPGKTKGVEAKTTDKNNAGRWGEEGTDQIDEAYIPQVMHQMLVCDLEAVDVPVLIGGNTMKVYTVERNEHLISLMLPQLEAFWQSVLDNVAPPVDYDHPTTAKLLATIYPGTDGTEIELPEEIIHWHEVMLEAKEKAKTDKALVEAANNHIRDAMGQAAIGWLKDNTCYVRKAVKKKAYEVAATEYVQMRHTKRKKRKES